MKLLTIADSIVKGDITQEQYNILWNKVNNINVGHRGDTDEVVSKLVLYIKENYNYDYSEAERGARIYKTILGLCQDEGVSEIDGTLYSPPPQRCDDKAKLNNNEYENMVESVNFGIMEEWFTKCLTERELYIYNERIKGGKQLSEISKELGISDERVSKITNATLKKIKDYIEKYLS